VKTVNCPENQADSHENKKTLSSTIVEEEPDEVLNLKNNDFEMFTNYDFEVSFNTSEKVSIFNSNFYEFL
jgi:hypothetical protein